MRFDKTGKSSRDPTPLGDLVVGGLYHLEWDAHDEGGAGLHRYLGRYEPTGAWMFQPIRRLRRSGAEIPGDTIYLFPHEIQYIESLTPATRSQETPSPSRAAPQSQRRPRIVAPTLRPGRVLLRPVRSPSYTWDIGIVGPAIARAARFVGFRRIDRKLFAAWTEGDMLYAQPWEG